MCRKKGIPKGKSTSLILAGNVFLMGGFMAFIFHHTSADENPPFPSSRLIKEEEI